MANIKIKNKATPIKKWLVTFCVIIGLLLVGLYFYKWHQVRVQEKYLNSYLVSSGTINLEMNDISEINSVLMETSNYYFVYIGYTEDKNVYNFERKLKPLIDEYDLQSSFYFINVTDIKKNNMNYKMDIAYELNIADDEINEVPVILYFKDGNLIKGGITTAEEFEKLLKDEY